MGWDRIGFDQTPRSWLSFPASRLGRRRPWRRRRIARLFLLSHAAQRSSVRVCFADKKPRKNKRVADRMSAWAPQSNASMTVKPTRSLKRSIRVRAPRFPRGWLDLRASAPFRLLLLRASRKRPSSSLSLGMMIHPAAGQAARAQTAHAGDLLEAHALGPALAAY